MQIAETSLHVQYLEFGLNLRRDDWSVKSPQWLSTSGSLKMPTSRIENIMFAFFLTYAFIPTFPPKNDDESADLFSAVKIGVLMSFFFGGPTAANIGIGLCAYVV